MFRWLLGIFVFTRGLVGKMEFGSGRNVQELHEVAPIVLLLVLLSVLPFEDDVRGGTKFWTTPIFMLSLASESSTRGFLLSEISKSVASKTSTPKSSTLDLPKSSTLPLLDLPRFEMPKSSTLPLLPCLTSDSSAFPIRFLLL